jgi:hypothetical protein
MARESLDRRRPEAAADRKKGANDPTATSISVSCCSSEASSAVPCGGDEHSAAPAKADRVDVDKSRQIVKLFDRSNSLIGLYPATVGSEEKPSPTGSLKVTGIDRNGIAGHRSSRTSMDECAYLDEPTTMGSKR